MNGMRTFMDSQSPVSVGWRLYCGSKTQCLDDRSSKLARFGTRNYHETENERQAIAIHGGHYRRSERKTNGWKANHTHSKPRPIQTHLHR